MSIEREYIYQAKVLKVVDGDTVDLKVLLLNATDLGFGIKSQPMTVNYRFRLYGIDAPETRTLDMAEKKEGIAAKKYLAELLETSQGHVTIKTYKDKHDSFGRYLVTLYNVNGLNLNLEMLNTGHAEEYRR